MSRIGKLPIAVPSGVDVAIDGQTVTVKGPKGALSHTVREPIAVAKADDGTLEVKRPNDERESRSLHGLSRTLINNMVVGVTDGYEKKLEIHGVGYRVVPKGPTQLEFSLGYSHQILFDAPDGVTFTVEGPTRFTVIGHRQAGGRRGRSQHPQAPQARAVQGQGHPVRRRADPPQGRKGWQVMAIALKARKHTAAKAASRQRRQIRGRKKLHGSAERPRLVVTRSSRHLFVQVVDDLEGKTLASASTMEADLRGLDGDKSAKAKRVGELVAERAKAPASRRSSSTAPATSTTAGSPRWPTAPARAGWRSDEAEPDDSLITDVRHREKGVRNERTPAPQRRCRIRPPRPRRPSRWLGGGEDRLHRARRRHQPRRQGREGWSSLQLHRPRRRR